MCQIIRLACEKAESHTAAMCLQAKQAEFHEKHLDFYQLVC